MNIAQAAQTAAGRLKVRSALNPSLWLCGIVAVSCFVLAALVRLDRELMWAFFVVGAAVVLVTLGINVLFAIGSPEKLQSEDYQLRHEAFRLLQGAKGPEQVVDAEAIVAIANPALAALAAGAETGGGADDQ